MLFSALVPETSVSTNSTIWAYMQIKTRYGSLKNTQNLKNEGDFEHLYKTHHKIA